MSTSSPVVQLVTTPAGDTFLVVVVALGPLNSSDTPAAQGLRPQCPPPIPRHRYANPGGPTADGNLQVVGAPARSGNGWRQRLWRVAVRWGIPLALHLWLGHGDHADLP